MIYLLYLETFYSNSKLLDLFFQPENNTESGNKATCVTDLVGNVKNSSQKMRLNLEHSYVKTQNNFSFQEQRARVFSFSTGSANKGHY